MVSRRRGQPIRSPYVLMFSECLGAFHTEGRHLGDQLLIESGPSAERLLG